MLLGKLMNLSHVVLFEEANKRVGGDGFSQVHLLIFFTLLPTDEGLILINQDMTTTNEHD